jgi:hypothetical protein
VRRRILVLATSTVPTDRLHSTLADQQHEPAGEVEIRVVAPAAAISRLDWLTNAEDDARATAADQAAEVADALPADVEHAVVGDTDPVQAVEDTLRVFSADEIVVLRGPHDEPSWLEDGIADELRERLTIPVSQITVRADGDLRAMPEPPTPRPDPGPLPAPDPQPPNPDPGRPEPLDSSLGKQGLGTG